MGPVTVTMSNDAHAKARDRSPRASMSNIRSKLSFIWGLAARLVGPSVAHPWLVSAAGLTLGLAAVWFTAGHFAMTTDTDALLSKSLHWRRQTLAFDAAFPQPGQIVVVVDGATPELAEQAASALTARLQTQNRAFNAVERPDGGPFWARNGLLYESAADVQDQMNKLISAQPFLGPLAADPSLRGVAGALSTLATGVSSGQASLDNLQKPAASLANALEPLEAGKPAFFSWRALVSDKIDPHELRKLILVDPRLDFTQLEPGADASDDIRAAARTLNLDAGHGVRVRLTGPVPLEDEEFATLVQGAGLIGAIAIFAIVSMIWLAVRSVRTIVCILTTTIIGLVCAMAFGLLVFHRFNLISVAFIPLFVGLGVDFGIQFSVRFRTEQHLQPDIASALVAAGAGMARPLTLAASAISIGFLAFWPTHYLGVSQLGVIAGFGLIFALGLNLSVLPAMLRLTRPSIGRSHAEIAPPLHSLDAFMLSHRRAVVGTGLGAALFCAALLPLLHFDFNPMHLRSDKVESVSTLMDLEKDPEQSPNTVEVIAPSLAATNAISARLKALPEVDDVRTLESFIPDDQTAKLSAIQDASMLLDLTLNPIAVAAAPSDAENQAALAKASSDLSGAAGAKPGPAAADVRRLAADLQRLAGGPASLRARATQMLIPGLNTLLDQLRNSLQAQPVTAASLPPELVAQWLTPDGRARISVLPKGDSNNDAVLGRFTKAVLAAWPDAAGAAVSIKKSGDTIVGAFIEAGFLSFIAITLLLFAVLKRVRDVAITMAPIVLTGLLTLGTCILIGLPLNFANIIALPLLFGIGVAFHIYFVMAWRAGGEHLLESSLSRAVFFSALTTATGFGSLWASSHPGTASMGKLLMISLIWTLVSALLFQPALMGPPPRDAA